MRLNISSNSASGLMFSQSHMTLMCLTTLKKMSIIKANLIESYLFQCHTGKYYMNGIYSVSAQPIKVFAVKKNFSI